MAKSQMSKFSLMRSARVDFGITTTPALYIPAKRDLRGRLTVFRPDFRKQRVRKNAVPALRQRPPSFGANAERAHVFKRGFLREKRMKLDLIDGGFYPRVYAEVGEPVGVEIADAYCADFPRVGQAPPSPATIRSSRRKAGGLGRGQCTPSRACAGRFRTPFSRFRSPRPESRVSWL